MGVKTKRFTARLEADVVISRSSSSVGGHATLQYLPGSVFLGASAARLYGKLSASDAFDVYHGGKVRFGPAYLERNGEAGIPTPLSFFYAKREGVPWDDHGLLEDTKQIYNWSFCGLPTEVGQPKQIRDRFLFPARVMARPTTAVTAKTAIDRSTGAALEKHLFSYEVLTRGQRFVFDIDFDDDLDPGLVQAVSASLCDQPVWLGRSRSAEFGMTRIVPCTDDPATGFVTEQGLRADGKLVLYCFSEVALLDRETSQPTLDPNRADLGLPDDWELDWDQSFVRFRRYTPFNGKRRKPDLERSVIEAGSVFVFAGESTADLVALQERLRVGVGAGREAGLGRLWLTPAFLNGPHPVFRATSTVPQAEPVAAVQIDPKSLGDLADWATERHEEAVQADAAYQMARSWMPRFERHMARGKVSLAQWGALRGRVAGFTDLDLLIEDLFGSEGFLKSGVRAIPWTAKVAGQSAQEILKSCLEAVAKSGDDSGCAVRAVEILCAKIPIAIRQARKREKAVG